MTREPFDRVVQQHGARVYRVVRAVVGPSDADDAWSDAFLAALEAYPTLEPGANVQGWLVTIAHRKAIDVLRRASRATTVAAVPDRAAPHRDPDLDLRRALAMLPQRQRSTVVLHHLGGLPFDEVATVLDVSPAAARKASSDGVRRLRVLLEVRDDG